MARIVSGTAKGRNLKVPKSGTRPTSERVREGLFSRLDHRGYIDDCVILDLYAGSGALGLEAASRGARRVIAVEAAASAAKVIIDNVKTTGLDVEVINQKVLTYLTNEPTDAFDVVFIDPPYDVDDDDLALVLEALVPHTASDALVVVERNKKSAEPRWPAGLQLEDDRRWGDTRVWTAIRTGADNKLEP